MTAWTRVALIVLIATGLLLIVASVALIVLVYNLSRDGFAAWPDPAYIPAAAGVIGLVVVVVGIVSWRRRSRGA